MLIAFRFFNILKLSISQCMSSAGSGRLFFLFWVQKKIKNTFHNRFSIQLINGCTIDVILIYVMMILISTLSIFHTFPAINLALLMVCTFHSSLDMHDAAHTMMISDIATSAWLINFCHKAI